MITTFLFCAAVVFISAKLISWYSKSRQFWKCLENIPAPPAYPIVGHVSELAKPSDLTFLSDRKWALQYYPIFKLCLFNLATVNLVSPQDIELVLTNSRHISKSELYDFLHGWLGTGLLTSTGAKWQTRRKILTPAFHFNILQEFIIIFNEETKKLVRDLEDRCHERFIDVVQPITQFTLLSIAETAMGITLNANKKNREGYKRAIYQMGELITYRASRPWMHNETIYNRTSKGKEEKTILKTLHEFTRNVIQERKEQLDTSGAASYSSRKRLAMLDLLLSYQAKGADIDEEGIREEVDTFMFEGHDTTSTALCYTLMLLANHKEIQDEIVREMVEVLGDANENPTYAELQGLKYMERCIKESLRLYPSVPFISRVAGEDIQTRTGYTIPKDCIVNVHIYDLHHSPHVYPNPEKFDPDRFLPENVQKRHPFAYVPFSAGPRNCIGQKFAVLEMKAVLCGILKKFALEPVDKPEDMVFITDMVLRSKNPVRVKFELRK